MLDAELKKVARIFSLEERRILKSGLAPALDPPAGEPFAEIRSVELRTRQVGASCEAGYSATKGAVLALSKALAQELGPSGIRVNAIAPGVIRTDMCASVAPEIMEQLRSETPIERLGTPEDVADAMVYLADAPFVTGQVIAVNGGFVIT